MAVRYSQRLAEEGAVASVGSRGDSYDNALAEAFNSLFKAELIRNNGPWRSIDWFNHRRLHGELGLVPPAEYEAIHRSGAGADLDRAAGSVRGEHARLADQLRPPSAAADPMLALTRYLA